MGLTCRFTRAELAESPSRKDGIDHEREARYKRECVQFIKSIAATFELTPTTYCTAMAIFHRFFATNSFLQISRYNAAAACLVIAGKIEEQPKKLSVLLPVVYKHKLVAHKQKVPHGIDLSPASPLMRELHAKVLGCERMILQSIQFELSYPNPFDPLIKFARSVAVEGADRCPDNLVQTAVNFVNDSYLIPLCLLYEPQCIAAALLDRAAHFHKKTLLWRSQPQKVSAPPAADAPSTLEGATSEEAQGVVGEVKGTDAQRKKADEGKTGTQTPWFMHAIPKPPQPPQKSSTRTDGKRDTYSFIAEINDLLTEMYRVRKRKKSQHAKHTRNAHGSPMPSPNVASPLTEDLKVGNPPLKSPKMMNTH